MLRPGYLPGFWIRPCLHLILHFGKTLISAANVIYRIHWLSVKDWHLVHSISEAYSEPSQTSTMELFWEKILRLKVVKSHFITHYYHYFITPSTPIIPITLGTHPPSALPKKKYCHFLVNSQVFKKKPSKVNAMGITENKLRGRSVEVASFTCMYSGRELSW